MSVPDLIIRSKDLSERVVPIKGRRIGLGRSPDVEITLVDRKVSSFHAEIIKRKDFWFLRDLGSTNGTFINGLQVNEKRLADADTILIGTTTVVFSCPEAVSETVPDAPVTTASTDVAELSQTDEVDSSGLAARTGSGRETVKISFHEIEKELLHGSGTRRATAEALKARQTLAVLYKLSSSINALQGLSALLEKILDFIFEVVDADRAFIFFLDEATQTLIPKAVRKRPGIREGQGLAVSSSLLKQALSEGQAIITRDAQHDERFSANQSIFLYNIHSAMTIPLRSKNQILGVIHMDKLNARRPFVDDDLKLMAIICNQAATAVANAKLFDEVRSTNEELRKAKESILKWNLELEQKVEERTSEIRTQNEEISKLANQKEELLGMVAHDLRTPLTGILGFSEMIVQMLQAENQAGSLMEDVEIIHQTAAEMNALLTDLLDISKIESGTITIEPESCNLAALIAPSQPRFKRMAQAKGISFEVAVSPNLPQIELDPRRFGQILNNLISNAIKFSRPDDTIRVSARLNGSQLEICVADTGPGIATEDLDLIFGRFEQASAKATSGEAGSGLGLAITKRLVELHGGTICVKSNADTGATFLISLPLVQDSPSGVQRAG